MDQFISESVKSIAEMITEPSLINLDYADLRTVMSKGNTATVAYSENADDDPQRVVVDALNNPLLDIDYTGATGALVHITMGPNTPLKTSNTILETLTFELDSNANIIYGVKVSPEYEGKIKVMSVLTGIQSPQLLSPFRGINGFDARTNNHFEEVD
jgi:cell division protein FtsZ